MIVWRAKKSTIAITAALALLAGIVVPVFQAPSAMAAAGESLIDGFDDGAGTWVSAKGSITPTGSPDASQGTGSLSLAYDLAAGSVEAGRTGTLPTLASKGYSALKLDVKGDGTYNTLYVRFKDATGEVLYYRVANLNSTSWTTATVNLSAAAAATSGGNANGILDAPIALYRFVIVRNGSQPATGTALVDNVRTVDSGWTAATADPSYFSAATGQVATIGFVAGTPGDYSLRLSDAGGHSREILGTAGSAGAQAVTWDGAAGDGSLFVGDVSAVLAFDSTPNGVLTTPTSIGTPLLTTAAAADVATGTEAIALAEGFESAGSAWVAAKGTVTPTASTDVTEGSTSLKLDYDLTAGSVEAGWKTTPAGFAPTAYSALKLDYKGDGTFNTLYLRLRDATGEILYYRVGTLNSKTWSTAAVDLRAAAAASSGGNANGVLDAPIALYRLVVVRNGTQPATGTLLVDNMRTVGDGWGAPTADTAYFSVDEGQPAKITVPAQSSGDFQVTLKDPAGVTRTLTGSSDGAAQTLDWDGMADSGQPLQGDIAATLAYDTIADGTVSTPPTSIGNPLLTTVAERVASSTLVEGFDDGADSWVLALGKATPRTSADTTQGASALDLAYDLTAGSAEVGRTMTPGPWNQQAYSALKVDYKGDGTFNTFYLRVQDATGEVFYYRVGTLNTKTWTTATIDLTAAPAANSKGNADGVLDGPLSLYRLVVVRNGTQPATGSVIVDNLRAVGDGWTGVTANPQYFSAAAGQSTVISVQAATPGDYTVTLSDPAGTTRSITKTVTAAGASTFTWDGKTSAGVSLQGNISARLSYDTAPDGQLTAARTLGIPYLGGVTARTSATANSATTGVNSALTTYDSIASADADAKLIENASVHYAREEFEWNRIEPRNGYFEWAKFDQAVAVAKARNIEIVGRLVYTADWASSAPAGTPSAQARYYPPANMADWNDYVAQTVARYKDSVSVWEVWNEPNLATYWMPTPDASQYAEMLKASYSTIKAIAPQATVLLGGLAGGFSESYMNTLIASGAGNSFDGVAIHIFVVGAPESGIIDTWMNTAETYIARKLPGRSLWITEVGWSTCGSCTAKVTEDQQAQYLSRFMIDAASHGVKGVMWFNLRESGTSTSTIDNYGLIERDGRVKPAYTALSRFAAATIGSVYAGSANPSPDGTSTLVNDFATTSGLKASSLGTGGSTTVSVSSGRIGGAGALAVKYNYSTPSATGGLITLGSPVSGSPTALSLWAYGDNSNASVMLKFTDATGEAFEAKIGNVGTAKWTRMVFYFDGTNPSYTHSGGNNDAKIDYPIKVTQIHVYKSSSASVTSGQFILDDLTAHYGAPLRGAIFTGRGYVTEAVYAIVPRDTKLIVPNTTAYIYDRGTVNAVTVQNRLASVTLTPTPKFVIATPTVSPVTGPAQTPVSLALVTGDRTMLTVQVYSNTGVLIRTLTSSQSFVSGARSISWDGRKSDGTWATAGAYTFRIQTTGIDGRSSVITRYFSLS
ncbi:FlgD immunoglobulin-like domain containing protein [Herbiconiux sp.]|uniref:FlgD immunoglobulin-like domain containing protein n=1 Tax=Herbiconiux sp. TaxID=1871186 RepID=UPI0025BB3457|nr:FlgD immunoglobulin-like domain containing protein [Herbiconiux sp.]